MNREEKIKRFENEQLEILLNDLQDVDKFTAFKNGAFKYELGKYQANLLVNCIKKQKEVIDKAIEYINLIVLGETLNGEPVLFKEEAEGQYLLDILKEVE